MVALTYEDDSLPTFVKSYASSLSITVNGTLQSAGPQYPTTSLLNYLRANGLTGTKLGCNEGGCGSCTVLLSKLDVHTKKIKHISVNACLFPAAAAHGCHITTVEGLARAKKEDNTGKQLIHPIQERMVKLHGSQCGYCVSIFR